MRWSTVFVVFSRFWLILAIANKANTQDPLAVNTVPNSYIISLDTSIHLKNGRSSPHAELRHGLELHGINLTITRVYKSSIFQGAVVLLSDTVHWTNLKKLAVITAIDPVNVYPGPNIAPEDFKILSKRARPSRPSWTHTMTGVDRVHADGNFGEDVNIAIIDSGVDYYHPSLGGGIGDDYKIIGGYDFVGNAFTGQPGGPPPQESPYPLDTCNGHGTFVAGVIGADANNEYGILGVAPQARIRAYRILGCAGATSDDLIMAALTRAHEEGSNIINISSAHRFAWGQSATAVVAKRLADSGRIVVFSTGNDGQFGSWYAGDIGNAAGIIHVGNVQGATPNAYRAEDATMAATSSYGPSNTMHMRPTLSAPGENVLSLWPRNMGRFKTASGTSAAVPFVAGSVALWLRANVRNRVSDWAASIAFQNTAYTMPQSQQAGSLIETLSHQGAGLIQTYEAIHAAGSMSPAELLLNDTRYPRLSQRVTIRNFGQRPVRYRLTHVPAGTVPTIQGIENIMGALPLVNRPAIVVITPNQVTVAARSSKSVTIDFRPPTGLDPTTFPVYSGYIRATTESGLVLQSTYLGVAAALYGMKVLDTTSGFYPHEVPLLRDINGNPIRETRTYSMQGYDIPELVFRLVAGTPLLRLDLVDARTTLPSQRSLSRSRGWSFCGSSRSGSRSSFNKRMFRCLSSGSRSGSIRMRGLILEAPYVPRNLRAAQVNNRIPINMRRIRQFADGREIPNGSYKLLLRVLKITGEARQRRDWEYWLSPQINIHRPGG